MNNTLYFKARLLVFTILVFFLLAPLGWAATYYVDATNGRDTNTGLSEATAWKTITKVNASRFQPGDQILFKAGKIWRETLLVPSSGTNGHPITFGAYGTGANPIISGADIMNAFSNGGSNIWDKTGVTKQPMTLIINGTWGGEPQASRAACTSAGNWVWTGNTLSVYATSDPSGTIEAGQRADGVFTDGKNYLTFRNLEIQGTNRWPMSFNNGDNIDVQYCTFRFTGRTAYYSGNVSFGTGSTNCTFSNNTVDYSSTDGVWSDSTNFIAQNNTMSHIYGANSDGIQTSNATNCLLTGNVIDMTGSNTTKQCIIIQGGAGPHVVSGNTCIGGGAVNLREGIMIDVSDITVSRNLVSGVNGPSTATGIGISSSSNQSNITIEYNVISNCKNGLRMFNAVSYDNLRIYNNTIYGSTCSAFNFSIGSFAGEIKNNISWTTSGIAGNFGGSSVTAGKSLVMDYNIWGPERTNFMREMDYTYRSTIATWISGTGYDRHSRKDDPLFVNAGANFYLRPSSPCIDTGANVGVTQDYNGTTVLQGEGVDIGAIESVPGTRPVPPQNLRIY